MIKVGGMRLTHLAKECQVKKWSPSSDRVLSIAIGILTGIAKFTDRFVGLFTVEGRRGVNYKLAFNNGRCLIYGAFITVTCYLGGASNNQKIVEG